MDRDTRILQHIKAGNKAFTTKVPSVASMDNGEEKYVWQDDELRLYTKQQGQMFYRTLVKQTRDESASEAYEGFVELASTAECQTGMDTTKAVTPDGLTSAFKEQSWTQDNGLYIATDEIRARDSGGLKLYDDSGAAGVLIADGGSITQTDGVFFATDEIRARDAGGLKLYDDSGAVGLFVEDGGEVGIGTILPQSLLDIQGPAGTGAASAGILTLATKELTIVDGDELGRINFNAPLESDGSDAILSGAAIWAEADDTFSATVNSTELVFATASTSAAIERMRIDSTGNVGIGTSTPAGTLHIHVGAGGADPLIYMSDDDVAHGCTVYAPNNVFGVWSEQTSASGGLLFRGLSDDNAVSGLTFNGIVGNTAPSASAVYFYGGKKSGTGIASLAWNETVFRFDNYGNVLMVIRGVGHVGFGGITAPAAMVDIDQSSASGTVPVLKLDQGDVSEEFIRFVGTSANAVLTQSIVEAADVTTATIAGYLKIYVSDDGNQVTDAAYFVPFYSIV